MSVQCKGEPLLAPADRRGGAASYLDGCCDGNGFSLSRPVSGASSSSPSMAVVGAERACHYGGRGTTGTGVLAPQQRASALTALARAFVAPTGRSRAGSERNGQPGASPLAAAAAQWAHSLPPGLRCDDAVTADTRHVHAGTNHDMPRARGRARASAARRARTSARSGGPLEIPVQSWHIIQRAALPASTPPQQEAGGAHR